MSDTTVPNTETVSSTPVDSQSVQQSDSVSQTTSVSQANSVSQTTSVSQANSVSQLQTITVPEGPRFIARVKWFDNSLSYGFATVTFGEHAGKDIFVHQSNILTLSQGVYRTLRMGEYIEFNLEENADSSHKYQAIAVTGPGAGQLMCETNPRRPRVHSRPTQPSSQPVAQTKFAQSSSYSRRNRRVGNYRQQSHTPIQVVVEYPNGVGFQRSHQRRPRQSNNRGNQSSNTGSSNNGVSENTSQ